MLQPQQSPCVTIRQFRLTVNQWWLQTAGEVQLCMNADESMTMSESQTMHRPDSHMSSVSHTHIYHHSIFLGRTLTLPTRASQCHTRIVGHWHFSEVPIHVFFQSDAVATIFLLFILVRLLFEGSVYFVGKLVDSNNS